MCPWVIGLISLKPNARPPISWQVRGGWEAKPEGGKDCFEWKHEYKWMAEKKLLQCYCIYSCGTTKPVTTTIELVIACYCVCDRSESPYNSYKKEKDIETMYFFQPKRGQVFQTFSTHFLYFKFVV